MFLFLHPVLGEVRTETNDETYKSMDTLSYKTISVNKENADKKWLVINAEGQILGRLASEIAKFLRGKHKPSYTPHSDCGDNVIVINAEKIALTGKKMETKYYIRHTGYPGGQRTRLVKEQLKRKPIAVVEHAVKGMLPKTKLGAELFRNLYVYDGPEHKQQAQQPKEVILNFIK